MGRFATALLAEIPHEGRRIDILNCGHPSPLLLNRRNLRVLESAIPSPPLNPAEPISDHYPIDFPPATCCSSVRTGSPRPAPLTGSSSRWQLGCVDSPRHRHANCPRLFTATSSATAVDALTTTSPPSPYAWANPEARKPSERPAPLNLDGTRSSVPSQSSRLRRTTNHSRKPVCIHPEVPASRPRMKAVAVATVHRGHA